MFIGHFAVALGAKAAAPRVSLGTWVIAAQFLDLVWPVLVLLGLEHFKIAPAITAVTPLDFTDYPFSHSLLSSVLWGGAVGAAHFVRKRDAHSAVWLGAVVVSHWVLDFVSHRPDMPLLPLGGPRVGLGLWYSIPATVLVEGALFVVAVAVWMRTSRARDRMGRYGGWAFVLVLLGIYAANFQSVPPNEAAVAVSALGMWLFVAWAYWIDRHRELAVHAASPTAAPA